MSFSFFSFLDSYFSQCHLKPTSCTRHTNEPNTHSTIRSSDVVWCATQHQPPGHEDMWKTWYHNILTIIIYHTTHHHHGKLVANLEAAKAHSILATSYEVWWIAGCVSSTLEHRTSGKTHSTTFCALPLMFNCAPFFILQINLRKKPFSRMKTNFVFAQIDWKLLVSADRRKPVRLYNARTVETGLEQDISIPAIESIISLAWSNFRRSVDFVQQCRSGLVRYANLISGFELYAA